MNVRQVKLAIAAILSLAVIVNILSPIVYAVVFAYLASPFFNRINHYLTNRFASALITTLGILGVIVIPVTLAAKSIYLNADRISVFISEIATSVASLWGGALDNTAIIETLSVKGVQTLAGFALEVPKLVLHLFVMIVLIFYFLKDGPNIKKYLLDLAQNERQISIINGIEGMLRAIILGYFASAILIGFIAWIGFTLLGVQYATILAIGVGICALTPILNTAFVYVPVVIYEMLVGNLIIGSALIAVAVVVQVLELWLGPRISSHYAKIHPAIMLIGFIGGPLFFGIKGLILGPIILGTFKIILDHYRKE